MSEKITQQEFEKRLNGDIFTNQSLLVEMLLSKEVVSIDDVVNLYNDEDEPQEVYEWWVVSDWLLDELEKAGQPVLKTDYENWWGRTSSGQSIIFDEVIQKIYNVKLI